MHYLTLKDPNVQSVTVGCIRGHGHTEVRGEGSLHTGLKSGMETAMGGRAKNISGEDTARSEYTEVGDRMY